MYYVDFETVSGSQVTIFFTDKVTVNQYRNRDGVDEVCVMDGLHNNGGWKVKGTYQEVVNKVKFAIGLGVK
jgi:hypothetical protein